MDDFFDFNLADFPVNRFEFTVLVSQRVRLLASGAESVLERRSKEKDTILALREVVVGKLDFDALYDLAMKKYASDLKADDELAGYKTAAMGHATFVEKSEDSIHEQIMVLDSSKATISKEELFVDLNAISDVDDETFDVDDESDDIDNDSSDDESDDIDNESSDDLKENEEEKDQDESLKKRTISPYEYNEDEDEFLEDDIKLDEDE